MKLRIDTVGGCRNNNGKWVTGQGAVDLYSWDAYPLGFDCSNPSRWNGLPGDGSYRRRQKDGPLFIAEMQAGAFDPWGGPGYDACRELTGEAFGELQRGGCVRRGISD